MKIGDTVKVLDGDRWIEGRILEVTHLRGLVEVGEPHWFNTFRKEYSWDRIRRYNRIENPDEAVKAMYSSCQEQLKTAVHNALTELLPGESGVVDDDGVSLYHRSVTIQPCIFEVKGIGVDREVIGWSVSGWSQTPDTRTEPGTVEEIPMGEFRNYGDAIQAAIKAVFELKVRDYFQWSVEAEVVP